MGTSVQAKSSKKEKISLKKPSMYKVLIHNDDVTPMDFVVSLLMVIFRHTENRAYALMMKVHTDGVGMCGIYTLEIAQTRMLQAQALAQSNNWPLQITMEEEVGL